MHTSGEGRVRGTVHRTLGELSGLLCLLLAAGVGDQLRDACQQRTTPFRGSATLEQQLAGLLGEASGA